jgi:hypothetical protein
MADYKSNVIPYDLDHPGYIRGSRKWTNQFEEVFEAAGQYRRERKYCL